MIVTHTNRIVPRKMSAKIPAALAALLLASSVAFAQTSPGGMNQPGQQPGATPGTYPGSQPMPGADNGMNTNMPSPRDQSFVEKMMESDAAEVQLGQLAQEKSQSDDVKQLGAKMVENRKLLDDQLAPIAKQLSISQPKQPTKKDRQEIAKLEALSGPQFDQEYLRAVMKGHEKDVKDLKSESQGAQNPNLQKAAQMDEPVIAQHLQAIHQIAQAHNVTEPDDTKK